MKKRRNKLVTLGMAAMMTAALMSGCGKKATPENLLKDMAKNMKDTESVVANMKMDMEMGDDTTTIGIQMDMDIDMDLKSGESHAKGAVDMKMMGTNVGTEIEMYTVKEKDQYIVYTMANDQWQKEEMDDSAADMAGELSDLTGSMGGHAKSDAFQQESQKRIRELYMYDVLRADRCISSNSIEARVPFGDLDFVRYVMAIDPEKKLNSYGKGKYLLRKAFEGDWLPPEILWREKAAFSDAVGHSMVDDIKEYAESLYTDEEFQLRRANYSAHCMPFTKESLFYREIFEKYYHDQSRTIVGFWMPNKAWPNCNVNDPSARVLANYGASGV